MPNPPTKPLSHCEGCPVRHRAVCGALSEDELERLNRISRHRTFQPGETIVDAGAEADFVANIVSGAVKLSKMLADGRQQIVALQFAPDFLGRTFRASNPYHAEAATAVELCVYPRRSFERLLEEMKGMEMRLFQDTLNELDAARDWMLLLGRKTAQEKVASFLYLIARRTPEIACARMAAPGEIHFQLPLSRADIADYLGLTIETVSRQISRLKTHGIIRMHGTREFSVKDMEDLIELADIDPAEVAPTAVR